MSETVGRRILPKESKYEYELSKCCSFVEKSWCGEILKFR